MMSYKNIILSVLLSLVLINVPNLLADDGRVPVVEGMNVSQKNATRYTVIANNAVKTSLPFGNTEDFDNATRGFKVKPDGDLVIMSDDPTNTVPVWDVTEYKAMIGKGQEKESPNTVNPSLWRNAQLGMYYGLFEVIKNKNNRGIYQVRGYDLSNITFIEGDSGWIVLDPLISPETAKAALALINSELGARPVKAVIYSHSHTDHYGGVKALLTPDQLKDVEENGVSASVKIIAPIGFTEHAVSENVIAGNAMSRRAVFMYGLLLPRNEKGTVNAGLGMATSTGVPGLLAPNISISATDEEIDIDGVRMVFQMTPGTEAPAEMNTWFPQWRGLWMAENTTNTMHNVLTLRGALVRDPLVWAKYLNETIEKWGSKAKVKFQSHHWPVWDKENIIPYFEKQRDIYKFTHDQSVRLMNQGFNGEEISEMLTLPKELEGNWPTRGYYGTLRHNSRAVYQRYMGWYNGNPSNLNNLPQEDVAKKYMKYMGGIEEVIRKAKQSYLLGEYRWVAEVMKHAVFSDPNNGAARELLADTLEQLGYQSESGPWRSVYLQGADELRFGTPNLPALETSTPDTISAMSPEMLFDYFAVRFNINNVEYAARKFMINVKFTNEDGSAWKNPIDSNDDGVYTLSVDNAVLNYTAKQRKDSEVDVTATLSMDTMHDIQLKEIKVSQAIRDEKIVLTNGASGKKVFKDFVHMLDDFTFWFNIVTP